MVDNFGRWTKEDDYSTYPKEKWCDLDYVAAYLDEEGYVPQYTNYHELIMLMIQTYEEDIEEHARECGEDIAYYAFEDTREYPENLMINMQDFKAWLSDIGEISDFDYEA